MLAVREVSALQVPRLHVTTLPDVELRIISHEQMLSISLDLDSLFESLHAQISLCMREGEILLLLITSTGRLCEIPDRFMITAYRQCQVQEELHLLSIPQSTPVVKPPFTMGRQTMLATSCASLAAEQASASRGNSPPSFEDA